MVLQEDLDALCTQQQFRAAESSHLEDFDFDLFFGFVNQLEVELSSGGRGRDSRRIFSSRSRGLRAGRPGPSASVLVQSIDSSALL